MKLDKELCDLPAEACSTHKMTSTFTIGTNVLWKSMEDVSSHLNDLVWSGQMRFDF